MVLSLVAFSLVGTATVVPPPYWPKFSGAREVTILDGPAWDYEMNMDPHFDSMDPTFSPSAATLTKKTEVPSCSDNVHGGASGYLGPRGVAMYQTTFTPTAGPIRLQFQSCSFYCRVWVNGKEVGDHRAGGYVPFHLDVAADIVAAGNKADGTSTLFVIADNRFNATTAPLHTGGDFWHYGGLIRSVEVHSYGATTSTMMPWRAYVLPSTSDIKAKAYVVPTHIDVTLQLMVPQQAEAKLVAMAAADATMSVSMAFDGGAAMTMTGTADSNGAIVFKNVAVPAASQSLWSTETPNMHTLTVTTNGGTIVERFGLRHFHTMIGDRGASRFAVNGKILKTVGWNHHTQWPVTAASPTDAQLDADIALLKQGGANYVRGAHYPQDPRWLDRLDAAGIVMWVEALGPSVSLENTQDWSVDGFMQFQLQQMREMLDGAFNHASIMTWGWFNEGPSDKVDACPAYGACADYAYGRDHTRFGTWASDTGLRDQCWEHASLISVNNYPAWYNQLGNLNMIEPYWMNVADAVAGGTSASGAASLGKPFVISETGAGGIFEWENNSTDAKGAYPKWSLAYQSQVISRDVDVCIAHGNISGCTLWHFFDFKVENCNILDCSQQENNTHCKWNHDPPTTFADLAAEGPPNCTYIKINGRPGGENHKGSIDFWRRPKPIFHTVAAKYNASRVEAGADANAAAAKDGVAPLYIAAQHDHLTVVTKLIAAGADVNKARTDGGN